MLPADNYGNQVLYLITETNNLPDKKAKNKIVKKLLNFFSRCVKPMVNSVDVNRAGIIIHIGLFLKWLFNVKLINYSKLNITSLSIVVSLTSLVKFS